MDNETNTKQVSEAKALYDKRKQEKVAAKERTATVQKVAKRSKTGLIVGIVVVLLGVGGYFGVQKLQSIAFLPPISSQNHSEASPEAHIMDTRISDRDQRHMLEHADGGGFPGIIIQYNCDAYDCTDDLVSQLTTLVEEYPDNVYLAPNRYDGKIILTKAGQRKILDQFDETVIREFIGPKPAVTETPEESEMSMPMATSSIENNN